LERRKTTIVCAHSIYPNVKSSEGIVNMNWCEIVQKNENNDLYLLSSDTTVRTNKNKYYKLLENTMSKKLVTLFNATNFEKKSFLSIVYKGLNFIYVKSNIDTNGLSLYQFIWTIIQSKNLKKIVKDNDDSIVVWSRILPVFSLLPVINAYSMNKFPLIVNVNDPLDTSDLNSSTQEETIFLKTRDIASCWTFPSLSLAKYMAGKYKLDSSRCFVIPHAMKDQENLFVFSKKFKSPFKIVYTGTFYKSAFTERFGENLKKFSNDEISKNINFVFILSQYDNDSIEWLKNNIPNCEIHYKLPRERVMEIIRGADCMLVVDSILHFDLLKGKLVEAISTGIPILSITYANSVMDKVTIEYGGFVAYHDVHDDVYKKLVNLVTLLNDSAWQQAFYSKRNSVISRVSESNILKITNDISQYALNNFLFKMGKSSLKPEIPNNLNWP